MVHTPTQAHKRMLVRYKGLVDREADYATMVESVDNALGELVKSLERAKQYDNTVIVFTSDNGGLSQVARGGYPNLHNLPLRSGKGSAYEGGVRVPFVIAGPGVARGKVLDKAWISTADLFPTVTELAGIQADPRDGRSFARTLVTAVDFAREVPNVWHFPHYRGVGGPGLEPYSAIRMGDFKAIFFYGPRRWELYNLRTDLGETIDLSESKHDKLQELAGRLLLELKRMGAQIPKDAKSGVAVVPRLP